jgi:hypothetical protein
VPGGAECECATGGALIPLGDAEERVALVEAVWGEVAAAAQLDLDESEGRVGWAAMVPLAGLVGIILGRVFTSPSIGIPATILFILGAGLVAWRRWDNNPRLTGARTGGRPPGLTPRGAARSRPQLSGRTAIRGVVGEGPVIDAPISERPCLGFDITLVNVRTEGSSVVLCDGATIGFAIETEAGEVVVVPPGRLVLSAPRLAGDPFRARLYLAALDPLSESSDVADVFPFEQAFESVLRPGDRVALHTGVRAVPDPSALPTHYRESARSFLEPTSAPHVEVLIDVAPTQTP